MVTVENSMRNKLCTYLSEEHNENKEHGLYIQKVNIGQPAWYHVNKEEYGRQDHRMANEASSLGLVRTLDLSLVERATNRG